MENNNKGHTNNDSHSNVGNSQAAVAGAAITPTSSNIPAQPANLRRAMSPSLPPHHHIRADDTNETENVKQESIKSNRRYYSTSSDRTRPSAFQRFIEYLRVKSRLLGHGIYVLIIVLIVAVLVISALVAYFVIVTYWPKPILVTSSKYI